jgi:hypothetical protein
MLSDIILSLNMLSDIILSLNMLMSRPPSHPSLKKFQIIEASELPQ